MSKTVLALGMNAAKVGRRLAKQFPSLDLRIAEDPVTAGQHLAEAHAIISNGPTFNEAIMSQTRRLEWIQALTTGVDTILACPSLPASTQILSTRGVHGPQMSELTFLHMLALSRGFPKMLANQAAHKWEPWPQPLLAGKSVTVLGVGAIAEAFAPRCKAFGMDVYGISAMPRPIAGFDKVFARAAMKEAVALADFFVIIVPYSADTDRIVDAGVIGAMKSTAFLINVARGGVIDETALLGALRRREIAGAGLDVFSTEPMPPDSPFWDLDNVIVTPKVGGMSDVYVDQIMPIVTRNLSAYLDGRPSDFINRVR